METVCCRRQRPSDEPVKPRSSLMKDALTLKGNGFTEERVLWCFSKNELGQQTPPPPNFSWLNNCYLLRLGSC
uniref:Uncharacterized protein n=1 Tax=Anguilla anguilla TaxID=7936 RepID=A0A0E9RAH0_ANGAN